MNKILIITCALLTILTCVYWLSVNEKKDVESITYFPPDTKARFLDAETSIRNIKINHDQFTYTVQTYSRTNEPAYLRQDISMIFVNGRLTGKTGDWKENTGEIRASGQFSGSGRQMIRTISFHHGEFHRNNDKITGFHRMSGDHIYVIPDEELFFRKPGHGEEKWKELLDKREKSVINDVFERLDGIRTEHYVIIPLTGLTEYIDKPLPSFTKVQSDAIIGRLWEGLYKNYFLGIRKESGAVESPEGTTIPLILLSKDKSHLYVVFETKSKEIIILKQLIPG